MHQEKEPNLMDIHRSFAQTDFGETLANQVRYERYKPDEVSNDRWVELLGADVNNLTHMPLTRGLALDFVRSARYSQPGLLDPDEEKALETAALIYDWAEAITADHETEEKRQLESILDGFDEHGQEIEGLIRRAAGEIVFAPDSKLGHIFNTIERIGYMRTAVRASRHTIEGTAPDCEEGLRHLVADVLTDHTLALLQRTARYNPVYSYIFNVKKDILAAFSVVKPHVFDYYESEQRAVRQETFTKAHARLRSWHIEKPVLKNL